MSKPPYSYRDDPAIPTFPDESPIVIIDGYCALCSGGIAFLLKIDRKGIFRVATVQSPTGRALYAHYGMNPDKYDTFTVISGGTAYFRTDGYIECCRKLGGIWKVFTVFRHVPEKWRDAVYWFLDRNRLKWFGEVKYCSRIPEHFHTRVIK